MKTDKVYCYFCRWVPILFNRGKVTGWLCQDCERVLMLEDGHERRM